MHCGKVKLAAFRKQIKVFRANCISKLEKVPDTGLNIYARMCNGCGGKGPSIYGNLTEVDDGGRWNKVDNTYDGKARWSIRETWPRVPVVKDQFMREAYIAPSICEEEERSAGSRLVTRVLYSELALAIYSSVQIRHHIFEDTPKPTDDQIEKESRFMTDSSTITDKPIIRNEKLSSGRARPRPLRSLSPGRDSGDPERGERQKP